MPLPGHLGFHLRYKAVATRFGHQQPRVRRIRFNLLAQAIDMGFQRMRRYAGIILDICYDHFLARHWSRYADSELSKFVSRVYQLLQEYRYVLPERLEAVLPRLFKENWLESYQTLTGVECSLKRVSNRFRHEVHLNKSIQDIKSNYEILEYNFNAFFPDLIGFTREWMDKSN